MQRLLHARDRIGDRAEDDRIGRGGRGGGDQERLNLFELRDGTIHNLPIVDCLRREESWLGVTSLRTQSGGRRRDRCDRHGSVGHHEIEIDTTANDTDAARHSPAHGDAKAEDVFVFVRCALVDCHLFEQRQP